MEPSPLFDLSAAAWKSHFAAAMAALRRWRRLLYQGIDHEAVMAHLDEEGGISARYCVLVALSCGIAILGLLLSSAAVVIGAMLISPLMSPIILLGFSLATLDYHLTIRSLKAIALGTGLAIVQAAIIVWLSPLNSVTPEILARTTPNFFDLLVAIFSAVAGAYAVAQRRGETIVGVAIATALMPPLAVIGYGLAVHNWVIFAGAGGLFMTNLLAIGLTASLVAKVFGFGRSRISGPWQVLGIVAVFAILSIPLVLSLQRLANEAVLTTRARTALQDFFAPQGDRVYGIKIAFPSDAPVEIEALVLTQKLHPGMENRVEARLREVLSKPVSLTLSQIPVHPRESLDRQAVEELVNQSNTSLSQRLEAERPDMAVIAAAAAGISVLDVSVDNAAKKAVLRSAEAAPETLARLKRAGQQLHAKYPDWTFAMRFDIEALPDIAFASGSEKLDVPSQALLSDIAWALQQDGIKAVRVIGLSDSGGSAAANRAAAMNRAKAVTAILAAQGIAATPVLGYPAADQRHLELEKGRAAFRAAYIEPEGP